jgi:hypothetical protein
MNNLKNFSKNPDFSLDKNIEGVDNIDINKQVNNNQI